MEPEGRANTTECIVHSTRLGLSSFTLHAAFTERVQPFMCIYEHAHASDFDIVIGYVSYLAAGTCMG